MVSGGLLRELEDHRLRAHGRQVLNHAGSLIDELLSLRVLPACLSDYLWAHRQDLLEAAERRDKR